MNFQKLVAPFRQISWKQCWIAFFASCFQAFGMYHIHAQAQVTEGGIFGLTLLLDHWIHISPAISGFLLNSFCYLLGWRTMGKDFIIKSFFAFTGFSLGYGLFEQFPPLYPDIVHYPLIAALLGSVFIGVGAGIAVRCGGATSGDDALGMSLSRILKVDIRWIYMASDLIVLVLSLSYIPAKRILYSLLTVTLSGQMIGLIQKLPLKKAPSDVEAAPEAKNI